MPHNDFYIYAIFRPDGSPCYIGKGRGYRHRVHFYKGAKHDNRKLMRIIQDATWSLPVVKIRENLSEQAAFEIEIALISAIGRGRNGPLVNQTDGGDGTSGIVFSPERRAAISAVHKGKIISDEHRAILRKTSGSRIWSDESRNRISVSTRGKKKRLSAEAREAQRARAKALFGTEEARKRVADRNKKREWTKEQRAAHGAKMARIWRETHLGASL